MKPRKASLLTMRAIKNRRIRTGCCIGIALCIAAAILCLAVKSRANAGIEASIEKFESGSFVLKGESVFFGENKVSHCPVEEKHDGDDFCLVRMDKSYIREKDQYYIDEGDGRKPVVESPADMAGITEMFNRKSELSNYSFSDLAMVSEYPAEIPTRTGESIDCSCFEYRLAQGSEEAPLRLYFVNDELYAIRSKEDNRFIFYVESLC